MFNVARRLVQVQENKIIRNSIVVFSGQAGVSLVAIANTILLLRAIGIEGLGILAIVSSYSMFFLNILSFQSFNALIKFGAEALEKRDIPLLKHYLKQAFLQDLITSFLSLLIGYVCVELSSSYFKWNNNISYFITIYLVTIPFQTSNFLKAVFRLRNDYLTEWKIGVGSSLLKLMALSVGLIGQYSLFYFVILEILLSVSTSAVVATAAIISLKHWSCSNFLQVKLQYDKKFTRFNLYNNIVSTLDMPTGQLTVFIINRLIGVSGVGTYNLIVKFGSVLVMIVNAVSQTMFPELSRLVAKNNITKAETIIKKAFSTSLIAGLSFSIILLVSHKLWLHFFLPATTYNLALIIIYTFFISITGAVSGIHLLFISLNLVRFNLPLVLFSNSLYILLLFLLSPQLGLIGVIISLIFQAILIAALKYRILQKCKLQQCTE